ncbi:MAG: DoxX-like family protein [Myxococcota bacterium]
MSKTLRALTGAVWLYFGPGCKWFGLGTDHQRLVAAILGEEHAGVLTVLIGAGEGGLALWALSGRAVRLCLVVQITLIMTMNVIELFRIRNLLVFGAGNFAVATLYCLFLAFLLYRAPKDTL